MHREEAERNRGRHLEFDDPMGIAIENDFAYCSSVRTGYSRPLRMAAASGVTLRRLAPRQPKLLSDRVSSSSLPHMEPP